MTGPNILPTYRYIANIYSFLNPIFPDYEEMKNWMFEELTQAEEAGEKVTKDLLTSSVVHYI